jgi:hypothetical protein
VQVVLGEGEPGILRYVLEAEGFQVVGQARGETELRRVLDVTHPSVIVLDAGISVTAAMDARTRAIGAQLVVVWPNGVRASVAEERVDPATALQDLGSAVRRAAERVTARDEDLVVTLPESPTVLAVDLDERPLQLVPDVEAEEPRRPGRRGRQLLMVAAAWTLALTASAAIGLAVPRTFGLFEPEVTPRPNIAPSPDEASQDRSDSGGTPSDASDPDIEDPNACGRPEDTGAPRSDRGRPDDPGRGCGQGSGDAQGKGRPDGQDEGNGSGRGEGGKPDTSGEPGKSGDGNGNGGGGGGGKSGEASEDEPAPDVDPEVDDGADGGNPGKGKSSARDAARDDSAGSNGRGNGPG